MKLIEISVYFSGVVVVAAESEEKAIAHINNMDVKDILAEIECVEKCDVDTFHIREPKSDDLEDEAHFVVKPAPSEGVEKPDCSKCKWVHGKDTMTGIGSAWPCDSCMTSKFEPQEG